MRNIFYDSSGSLCQIDDDDNLYILNDRRSAETRSAPALSAAIDDNRIVFQPLMLHIVRFKIDNRLFVSNHFIAIERQRAAIFPYDITEPIWIKFKDWQDKHAILENLKPYGEPLRFDIKILVDNMPSWSYQDSKTGVLIDRRYLREIRRLNLSVYQSSADIYEPLVMTEQDSKLVVGFVMPMTYKVTYCEIQN